MKSIYLASLLVILLSCNSNRTSSDVEQVEQYWSSTTAQLSIRVNADLVTSGWSIDPSLNPDVFTVECVETVNRVVFSDLVDSISFNLAIGDTIDFSVVTTELDTAHTRIIGSAPNHNFTAAYIKENSGKTKVEIPEVSELANILISLHRDAEKDKNMTDSESEYYKRVKAHFKPHLAHPMMDTVHHYVKDLYFLEEADHELFSNESYLYYYALKMNACTYDLTESGEIVNQGFIKEMAKGWSPFDPFKDKELMEDFASKSNFRSFYNDNQAYYDELLETYGQLNPIAKMQQWLDEKFGFSYGNYTIYFSPLVSGAHSTKGFDTEEFKQTFMFIAKATRDEEYSLVMNELLESRVVFTEIDHNYVNPTSDRYVKEINEIFDDRETWTNEELVSMYDTPFMVFNEYMTFAVYSLYVYDNYDEKDLLEYLPKMEKQMEDRRGFILFEDFNREMLELYKANPAYSVDDLYTHMLKWSEERSTDI